MRLSIHLTLLGGVLLLQGCASFLDSVAEFQVGWREMKVQKIDVGAEKVLAPDCRERPASTIASHRYAIMRFQVGGRPKWFVARVPPGARVSVGETFLVNVKDCDVPWRSVLP